MKTLLMILGIFGVSAFFFFYLVNKLLMITWRDY